MPPSTLCLAVTLFLYPLLSEASPLLSAISAFSLPTTLNLTAIGARNNKSTIECWQLDNPLATTQQTGVAGTSQLQLGSISDMSYAVIPPRYFPSPHNAPVAQYGIFLSGEARISLLDGTDYNVTIRDGKHALVVVTDVQAVSAAGHRTIYPSEKETVVFQMPFKDGKIPPHKSLHLGPCTEAESLTDN